MAIHLSDSFSYKKLLKFTFPSVIMSVFNSLYGIVDGLYVANYAGKSALAAVNFAFPILLVMSAFGYMFGAGGNALVGKILGEGKRKEANELFSLFVYICIGFSILFSIVGFFSLRPLMQLFGAEGEMLEKAVCYGNILLITLPCWNLQFLFQIMFVTAERAKLGLIVTLISGCANMSLDVLFVGVLGFGITGAAVATAISQFIGAAIPLAYFFSKNTSLLRLGKAKFDWNAIVKGTTNGASEFVVGVSSALVGMLYNAQLIKYSGENAVAAYGIMMYASMIFIGIFFGYANGSAPIVSYHYGAGNRKEVKNLFNKGMKMTVCVSVFMFLLSMLLSDPLSSVFAGYDPELYSMTIHGFRIYAISFLFSGVAILGSSFFTALNNGLVSGVLSFLRTIIFQVGSVLLLPLIMGIDGVWLSAFIAEFLTVITTVIFVLKFKKIYF